MSRTTLWGMVVVVVNLFLFPTTIVRQVRAFGLDKATSRSLPPQQLQHLQQSLSTYVETNNNEDDEENKWERFYAQGQSVPKNTNNAVSSPSPIRVVSFDLDNCLWRTDAVINGANDALAALLQAHGVTQRTEHVMKQLFAANQTKYAPACTNHAKAPVYLTQLRKDALAQLLLPHHDTEAAVATDYLFDAWAQARHDAIPDALADNVVSTLQRLRQHLHPPRVLMGAVTDGNADPRRLAILEPYFDFVVHAEAVGVAKPDPQIYLTAMQQVVSRLENEDDENENAPRYTITDDQVGAWWVHVGDDFVKDIVAAKAMGMRTVWTREFLPKNDQQSPPNQLDKKQGSVEELVKRVSSQKVVKMSVGAEDYLANSLQLDFADAVVDKFADLADILIAWHKEGQAAAQAPSDNNMNSPLEVVYPTKPSASPATDTPSPTTKFCVHCGTCLPAVAKFCSSCGENQPPLP